MLKLRVKSKKSIFKRMQTNNRLRLHSMSLTQTNNNLFVNLGDARGNTLHMVTTASRGFRGKKEIKSFLANVSTGEEMARRVTAIGVRRLNIRLKGFSKMKKAVLKGLNIPKKPINIKEICDFTPITFNGCRRKKHRHRKGRKKKRW